MPLSEFTHCLTDHLGLVDCAVENQKNKTKQKKKKKPRNYAEKLANEHHRLRRVCRAKLTTITVFIHLVPAQVLKPSCPSVVQSLRPLTFFSRQGRKDNNNNNNSAPSYTALIRLFRTRHWSHPGRRRFPESIPADLGYKSKD